MLVVAFVPDLMDRSRITNVQPETRFVDSPQDLVAASTGADLAIVDISRAGTLEVLSGLNCSRVVGFTNHTEKKAMETARAAGAVTLPRSDFFIRLEELLFES